MTAEILDGKAIAAAQRERIAKEVAELKNRGITPGLAAVLVGDDPASHIYVGMKHRDCQAVGMESRVVELPATVTQRELLDHVAALNTDDSIDGIIVQLPLPDGLDAYTVQEEIEPTKDVDALHPYTAGRLAGGRPTFYSATPYGVVTILEHAGIETAGKNVTIVGRSNLVGRPLSTMLSLKGRDATVTVAHSRTPDLAGVCRQADILIAAVGVAHLIGRDHVKEGAVVIDVGTNKNDDGKLVGDVDFDAVVEVASAITPVPGGVGPMTRAMLLQNTLEAARARRGLPRRPDDHA